MPRQGGAVFGGVRGMRPMGAHCKLGPKSDKLLFTSDRQGFIEKKSSSPEHDFKKLFAGAITVPR